MNWVRLGSASAALGVHLAVLGFFVLSNAHQPDLSALQSGGGEDELTIVAEVAVQTEESLGLDAAFLQRQEESAGGQPAPKPAEEAAKEQEKIELPLEKTAEPQPLIEAKEPEKKTVEAQPSNPARASAAQEEQRAASRSFEARRNEALSIYNGRVYRALIKNALRPSTTKRGRVVLELTLAPSGELLNHRVVVSSGSPALDRTAMTSLERAAPFPPVPPEVSKEAHTLRVPFEYAME